MKTPRTDATEFYADLATLGFTLSHFDGLDGNRCFERRNQAGHLDLRIVVDHEGGCTPHEIIFTKFNGSPAQIIQWQSRLSAYMPLAAVMGMIKEL